MEKTRVMKGIKTMQVLPNSKLEREKKEENLQRILQETCLSRKSEVQFQSHQKRARRRPSTTLSANLLTGKHPRKPREDSSLRTK